MKFIMSNGQFVCRENDERLNSISGTITAIRVITPEDAPQKVQIDFTEPGEESEAPVVRTLSLKRYGDASLKVLRCLYGVADILHGMVVTVELTPRTADTPAKISVSGDGAMLPPLGGNTDFIIEQRALIDLALSVLMRRVNFGVDFLIYKNDDGVYPTDADGDLDEVAIANYITDLRRTGRQGELTVIKTGFTSLDGAKAYKKALDDIGRVRYTTNSHKVAIIWDAYAGPLPEVPESTASDEADES